ncbi:uncharacterized protein LOC144453569 [Glandiceps talaboti]
MASWSNNPFVDEAKDHALVSLCTLETRHCNEDSGQLYHQRQQDDINLLKRTTRILKDINYIESRGVDTAIELSRQGPKLERLETRLDKMKDDIKTTRSQHKHLKRVVEGFTKHLSIRTSKQEPIQKERKGGCLQQVVQRIQASGHASASHAAINSPTGDIEGLAAEISSGLDRLKDLALGIGDELDRQNDLLCRLNRKASKADTSLSLANKEMRKTLYK